MEKRIICSKAELYLPSIPSASIDAMITDPPAGIGFMGKNWDKDKGGREQWIAWLAGIMHESLRAAKPSSYAVVWALPRTSHWTAMALEDAGWNIRDIITHLFGSGWPKSKALLKPASEHWILCKAPGPLEDLNIDDCRIDTRGEVLAIGSGMVGYKHDFAFNNPGEQHPLGRWPSNLLLSHHPDCRLLGTKQIKGISGGTASGEAKDAIYGHGFSINRHNYADPSGMEEMEASECVEGCPVKALDQQSGERKASGIYAKGSRYIGDKIGPASHGFIDGIGSPQYDDAGGASRFFNVLWPDHDAFLYQAKASRREKTAAGRIENTHPTVKSIALMRWLTRLIASPGDTILDPFMGTGTGGIAALERGCSYIGIDEDPYSVEIAEQRMDGIQIMLGS